MSWLYDCDVLFGVVQCLCCKTMLHVANNHSEWILFLLLSLWVLVTKVFITIFFSMHKTGKRGTRWCIWLRHCAKSQKVAGSIPDGVIGIFHWHNRSSHIMALGLTQPLTEMSTRNISRGKGGRCVGLTTLPPSCADCLEIWEPQPPGTLRACPGL